MTRATKRWLWAALAVVSAASASPARAQSTPAPQPLMYTVPSAPAPLYAPASAAYVPLGTPAPSPAPVEPVDAAAPRRRGGGNIGLIVAGAALLGAGWVLNFIGGLLAGTHPGFFGLGGRSPEPEWETFRYTSLVPIAGPWIQLAVKPTSFDRDEWGLWLIIDGLMQAAGTTMLLVAAVTAGDDDDAPESGVELVLVPGVGPGLASLTLFGRF